MTALAKPRAAPLAATPPSKPVRMLGPRMGAVLDLMAGFVAESLWVKVESHLIASVAYWLHPDGAHAGVTERDIKDAATMFVRPGVIAGLNFDNQVLSEFARCVEEVKGRRLKAAGAERLKVLGAGDGPDLVAILADLRVVVGPKLFDAAAPTLYARVRRWLDPKEGHGVTEGDVREAIKWMDSPAALGGLRFEEQVTAAVASAVEESRASRLKREEQAAERKRQAEYAAPVNEAERAKVLAKLAEIGTQVGKGRTEQRG